MLKDLNLLDLVPSAPFFGPIILGFLSSCAGGHEDCADFFLSHREQLKIDIEFSNEDGYRALMLAGLAGHLNIVKMLAAAGAEVNAQNTKRKNGTALMYACNGGHKDVAIHLLETVKSFELDSKCHIPGYTSMTNACRGGHIDIIRLLLIEKFPPQASRFDGATPLMIACKGGFISIAEVLLSHNDVLSNINAQDNQGNTAIIVASAYGHANIVELLIQRGAEVDVKASDGIRE